MTGSHAQPEPASAAGGHGASLGGALPATVSLGSLGGHRLLRSLGKGGLGEVYEAVSADGQTVALKTFILGDDPQGLMAAAFVREASLGQRLDHPDIVKVLGSGCQGEYAFLLMELVPGHDLRLHTRPGRLLPMIECLHLVERVSRALASAHAIGVIHRDIKPGNVLVHAPSSTVKITDFGLARLGDAFRSRTGIMAGTPGYMSPEQLAEGPMGPATDLYAVGVMLFEMLAGRLPHEAPSLGALLSLVVNRAAPLLTDFRPDAPLALSALVAELLERDPARRPPHATAVADRLAELRTAVAGQAPR